MGHPELIGAAEVLIKQKPSNGDEKISGGIGPKMRFSVFPIVLVVAFAALAAGKTKVKVSTSEIPVGLETKIISGHEAPPHSHPYQVSLQFMHPRLKTWHHLCGGSILDKKTILTAAHCVQGFESLQCRVDVGDHNLAKVEGSEQVFLYKPHENFYHPLWNLSAVDWDYAILKLNKPIEFNEKVQPIQLPMPGTFPDMDCVSSGWGSTRGDGAFSFPTTLQEVKTPLVDDATCQKYYDMIEHTLTDRVICAGGPTDHMVDGTYQGVCQGDSGGPLVCKDMDGVKRLVGIASFSTDPCAGEFPAGYARVSQALPWITLFMEKDD